MVTIVSCGILEYEINYVVKQLEINPDIKFLPSKLHINPLKLETTLEKVLQRIDDVNTYVVYGKCSPHIDDIITMYNAKRIQGGTCYEMVAGEKFFQLLKEEPGTFFLLPKFCMQFDYLTEDILLKEMRDTYFKNYKRCVFLDTQVVPVSCEEISETLKLPLTRVPIGIEILKARVSTLVSGKSI
ncbi:MAG: DUF1638 domain-containing protein [Candidatus Methanofastidiosia archaeon]|jgi:hypothetical protein